MIDKDGELTNEKVDRSVDKLIDQQALRVVKVLPKMSSANEGGHPVK